MRLRIFLNIFLFTSILLFPWWATLIAGILLLINFSAFEILIYGVFADALYATALPAFFSVQFLFTITFFILLLLSFPLKQKIIFYQN